MKKLVFCGVLAVALVWGRLSYAGDAANVDVNALVKTVNQLVQENADLKKRVVDLERQMGDHKPAPPPAPAAEPAAKPAQEEAKPAPIAATPEKHPLDVYWSDGLHLATPDKLFDLKIGGRVMVDAAAFHNPSYWKLGGSAIDETDGAEFREARLNLSGTLYKDYLFELEVDFADNQASIKDAYLGMNNIPFIHLLRVGHFVEPFGLEANISTSDTTFMERAMVSDSLTPYRALGIGFVAPYFDNRMTWGAGVFNRAADDRPYWDFSTRLTGLPWYEKDGRRLLHLGASYLHQTPNGEIRLSSQPESHLGNMHLDTGSFPAHDVDRWGFETALVVGPFSMQSEYIAAEAAVKPPYRTLSLIDVDQFFKSSRRFDGWYAQASVFVTGENRPYNTEGGWFERVVPRHNFTLGLSGWGAWELALRYSTLDLNDFDVKSGIIGGEGENWTAGVNWYMTPNTRLMFNYVRSKIKQYEYNGPIDIFQGRFQVDF